MGKVKFHGVGPLRASILRRTLMDINGIAGSVRENSVVKIDILSWSDSNRSSEKTPTVKRTELKNG